MVKTVINNLVVIVQETFSDNSVQVSFNSFLQDGFFLAEKTKGKVTRITFENQGETLVVINNAYMLFPSITQGNYNWDVGTEIGARIQQNNKIEIICDFPYYDKTEYNFRFLSLRR